MRKLIFLISFLLALSLTGWSQTGGGTGGTRTGGAGGGGGSGAKAVQAWSTGVPTSCVYSTTADPMGVYNDALYVCGPSNVYVATANIGTVTATPFGVGLNRGTNQTPAFAASPAYTVSYWTEGAGSMAIAYTGENSFTPTTPVACVIGQTYQFDLTLSAWTSGTFVLTACGVATPTVSPAAAGDFRFYITATAPTSPSVSAAASGAQAMTFSSFTMKRAAYDSTSLANVNVVIDTNAGLVVPLTVYMSPALAGWTYQEYVIAAYAVVVKTANGSDTWEWGTSTYTATLTFAAVRQTFLTLVSYANGYWDIAGLNGSVTPL